MSIYYLIAIGYVINCQREGKFVPPNSRELKVVIFFFQVEINYIVAPSTIGPLIGREEIAIFKNFGDLNKMGIEGNLKGNQISADSMYIEIIQAVEINKIFADKLWIYEILAHFFIQCQTMGPQNAAL
jgi:hypothetical protein